MSFLLFGLTALCGGLGACARYLLDGVIRSKIHRALPWGTILVNLSGSFLLGLLTGLLIHDVVSEEWQLALGTGFLGGYTTFSTASVETVRLIQAGEAKSGIVNAVLSLLGATLCAGAGLAAAAYF